VQWVFLFNREQRVQVMEVLAEPFMLAPSLLRSYWGFNNMV